MPSRTNRSATTNSPEKSRWDLTTANGRRCRDLYVAFKKAKGNPSDIAEQALIMGAAEKVVLAEIARADCLANPSMEKQDVLVRIEGSANRALARLKLDKVANKATSASDVIARLTGRTTGGQS